MVHADQGTIDALIKPAVRVGGHDRVEKHQTADAAARGRRRISVSVTVRKPHECGSAAQVAGFDPRLGLRVVFERERRDPRGTCVGPDGGHQ